MPKLKRKNSFTTIELVVSIGIIVIMGGIFLVNYRLQKEEMDLQNAASIISQETRKAQGFTMAQMSRPENNECGGGVAKNFAIFFEEGKNYIKLYTDKDLANECLVEDRYFASSIEVLSVTPAVSDTTAWITFEKENLKTKINASAATTLNIELCIRGDACSANKKIIILNNKGMIDIE